MKNVPTPISDHGDEEGVFAADDVAETAEEQRAERTHGKAGGEGEQGEDEGGGRTDAGEELLRQKSAPSVP